MASKYRIPELLAPAGGMEQLHAAINFGADAVYLAGKKFGMRARATNFTVAEIAEAVRVAHSKNVRVYITVNTMMHQADAEQLPKYFAQLQDCGVDACIVSDLGAVTLAKHAASNIDIHISTQAAVANSISAKSWANLGAKRVVLAREMSLKEISQMNSELKQGTLPNKTLIDTEVFVHGAMCMSVSGRCLISSYLTGRSANKGACTQPCRWGYKLIEEKREGQLFDVGEDNFGTYIMNSKDLNMSEHLHSLVQAGVASVKIEGRNKKAMYVASVVNAYRHLLDALAEDLEKQNATTGKLTDFPKYETAIKKWQSEFEYVSHRPYSTGFFFGAAEQSPTYDGYEQNRVHCADVLECIPDGDGSYKLTVLCRNRFCENEELEVLIPGGEIAPVIPQNLLLNGTQPQKVANRAKEIYTFLCDKKIPKGSFLRSKTFLRTSRKS